MISRAVCCHLLATLPRHAFILALPDHDFSTSALRLWAIVGWGDDAPSLRIQEEASHIVVVIRLCDLPLNPLATPPEQDHPLTWAVDWTRLMSVADHVQAHRIAVNIRLRVAEVYILATGMIIQYTCRRSDILQGYHQVLTIG